MKCVACRKEKATGEFDDAQVCETCRRAISYLWSILPDDMSNEECVKLREHIEDRNAFIYSALATIDGPIPKIARYEKMMYKRRLGCRKYWAHRYGE